MASSRSAVFPEEVGADTSTFSAVLKIASKLLLCMGLKKSKRKTPRAAGGITALTLRPAACCFRGGLWFEKKCCSGSAWLRCILPLERAPAFGAPACGKSGKNDFSVGVIALAFEYFPSTATGFWLPIRFDAPELAPVRIPMKMQH